MNYMKIKQILRGKGCMNDGKDLRYGYNKIRFHYHKETLPHLIAKAMLSFLIFSKRSEGVITEAELHNGRVLDILHIKKSENLIGYELDSTKSYKPNIDEYPIDVVDIDLRKMPKKAKEGIKILSKWLEDYII